MADEGGNSKGKKGDGKARKRKSRLSPEARRSRAARRRERRQKIDARKRAHVIMAIVHPLRRRMLQIIVEQRKALSPAQMAREFEVPVATVTYHAKVLWHFGALEPDGDGQAGGAIERLYETAIEDDPPSETLLEETRKADDEDTELGKDS